MDPIEAIPLQQSDKLRTKAFGELPLLHPPEKDCENALPQMMDNSAVADKTLQGESSSPGILKGIP